MTRLSEAEIEALISNIGEAEAVVKAEPGSPLDELLCKLMQEVVDALIQSLSSYDAVASANLMQSMIPSQQAYLDGDILTVNITAPNYWKFVNYGVNGRGGGNSTPVTGAPAWGTQPPTDMSFHASIMNWMRDRGIQNDPARSPTMEAAAWAIMSKIRRDGLKPRPFYSDVVNDDLISYLSDAISTLIGRAITVNIIEPFK